MPVSVAIPSRVPRLGFTPLMRKYTLTFGDLVLVYSVLGVMIRRGPTAGSCHSRKLKFRCAVFCAAGGSS